MKLQKYLTEALVEPLFDVNDAPAFAKEIEKKVKVPYISTQTSTLGGPENVSILLRVSLDDPKEWYNGIFHNSRYFQMHITRPNVIELFTKNHTLPKFRKARAKSKDDIIKKINDYIRKAR